MKRVGAMLLLMLVTIIALPPFAQAHNATITAVVTLDPATPKPGQDATVSVELVDAYYNDIPGARVRAAIEPKVGAALSTATLPEQGEGTYRASLRIPDASAVFFRLEANLPDGLWLGEFPLQIGQGGSTIAGMTLELTHQDTAANTSTANTPTTSQPTTQPQATAPAPTPKPQAQQAAPPQAPASHAAQQQSPASQPAAVPTSAPQTTAQPPAISTPNSPPPAAAYQPPTPSEPTPSSAAAPAPAPSSAPRPQTTRAWVRWTVLAGSLLLVGLGLFLTRRRASQR